MSDNRSVEPARAWRHESSPFHPGELAIQERLGVREKLDRMARRSVRDFLTEQHRQFYSQLPFLMVATVDKTGQPWASILVGEPGFLSSPDPQTLLVRTRPLEGDVLCQTLANGADVGLLGIELPTRRRNRLNGTIVAVKAGEFAVQVSQSFGNCPQYIQARELLTAPPQTRGRHIHRSERMDEASRSIVANSDTFFIATGFRDRTVNLSAGVDVSHRGGRPSFIRVDNDHTLTFPDFTGNFFFNTLGNLVLDPRAGLLFIDFASGDLLQMSGTVEIVWSGDEVNSFAGAERLLRMDINKVLRLEGALPFRWSAPAPSPLLARTGNWYKAEQLLAATVLHNR